MFALKPPHKQGRFSYGAHSAGYQEAAVVYLV